jgi:hypothetical protein
VESKSGAAQISFAFAACSTIETSRSGHVARTGVPIVPMDMSEFFCGQSLIVHGAGECLGVFTIQPPRVSARQIQFECFFVLGCSWLVVLFLLVVFGLVVLESSKLFASCKQIVFLFCGVIFGVFKTGRCNADQLTQLRFRRKGCKFFLLVVQARTTRPGVPRGALCAWQASFRLPRRWGKLRRRRVSRSIAGKLGCAPVRWSWSRGRAWFVSLVAGVLPE